MEFIVEDRY